MRATLISFDKMIMDIDNELSWIDTMERHVIDSGLHQMIDPAVYAKDHKIYEKIILSYVDFKTGLKVNEIYFVNYDDMRLTMPIVNGMVQTRTLELEKALQKQKDVNYTLVQGAAMMSERLAVVEGYWFNRLWSWLSKNFFARMKYRLVKNHKSK